MSSELRHVSTIEKNLLNSNISSTGPYNMVNFGLIAAEIGWQKGLGHHSKFQRVSRLHFVTALMSINVGQPNFAQCLAVSWAGILYINFRWLLPPNGIFARCKIHFALVLRSPILAALLHRNRTVGVRQTLRRLAECATYTVSQKRPTFGLL